MIGTTVTSSEQLASIRVKFHPEGSISPWLLLGGGYTRYAESAPSGALRAATNTGALEFGGGIDYHSSPARLKNTHRFSPGGSRLLYRAANYNLPVSGNLQDNSSSQAVRYSGSDRWNT